MTEYLASGFGLRLRPVTPDDADFIIRLRTQDRAIGNVGDTSLDVGVQRAWIEAQQQRDGDVYLLAETSGGIAVGTAGIVPQPNGEWEIGRWVTRPDTLAASGFATLMLDWSLLTGRYPELVSYVVVTNTRARKVDARLGFVEDGILPNAQVIGGQPVDVVRLVLTRAAWENARDAIVALAARAESSLAALRQ